jgi:hypothetical protein
VKLARLRRPKVACSPSYVQYRLNTNAAILWDMGHTKGRLHLGGIRQEKETKNLNEVAVLSVQEFIQKFKLARATMGRGLGRSEED